MTFGNVQIKGTPYEINLGKALIKVMPLKNGKVGVEFSKKNSFGQTTGKPQKIEISSRDAENFRGVAQKQLGVKIPPSKEIDMYVGKIARGKPLTMPKHYKQFGAY